MASFSGPTLCTVRSDLHGTLPGGAAVPLHRLRAPDGSGASVSGLGAAVTEVRVPDRDGRLANVVLAHPSLDGYRTNAAYLGAIVGRTAGRIGGARLPWRGRELRLPANEGPNQLHGGPDGFHRRLWRTAGAQADAREAAVELELVSPDGDQGHPGRLTVRARIAWTVRHELRIELRWHSDQEALANLTHHGTWNLTGEGRGTVDEHRLRIAAARTAELGPGLVATGRTVPVAGTALDLRSTVRLGDLTPSAHPQLALAGGLDHPYLLDDARSGAAPDRGAPSPATEPPAVAWLLDPESGRTLTVRTCEPCLQAYAGGGLDGSVVGPSGQPYGPRAGLALEPQRRPLALAPDDGTVRPGSDGASVTVFALGVVDGADVDDGSARSLLPCDPS
ncbi:MAG: aldose epimerase family protein [Trueperaceae bacterium]